MTDDSGTIPQKRDRSTAPAAHRSEIERRADEIRGIAAKRTCKTINDLATAFGWNMETARHANQVLSLGPPDSKLRTGPAKVAQSCPKPVKKGSAK